MSISRYKKYKQQILKNSAIEEVEDLYDQGFVFTRAKSILDQVDSLRINTKNFSLTSENRRVLRKVDKLSFESQNLPIPMSEYDWHIHKIGSIFYTQKFGDNTFSANKIRELCTSSHNFNLIFKYIIEQEFIGFCISFNTDNILHYSYPFYKLDIDTTNIGMGMMLKTILWSQKNQKKYIYLGSLPEDKKNTPSYRYKLQFKGLELWKDNCWNSIEI